MSDNGSEEVRAKNKTKDGTFEERRKRGKGIILLGERGTTILGK